MSARLFNLQQADKRALAAAKFAAQKAAAAPSSSSSGGVVVDGRTEGVLSNSMFAAPTEEVNE